jgi:hypothetical protein
MGFVLLRLVGSVNLENMLIGKKSFFMCNGDMGTLYIVSLVEVAVCVEYL